MMPIPTDEEFDALISRALDDLPEKYTSRLQNVLITYEDEPSLEQRERLKLRCNQSLFGLYEGVPLPARGGREPLLPDKITLFKIPMVMHTNSSETLYEQVRHTLWHEMAHYFGLDHKRIHELE
jgi:predicted Zn-dependent protease with MMP-like domain